MSTAKSIKTAPAPDIRLDRGITASPHHRITASPHHRITASPHHRITASQHHHVTRPTSPSQVRRDDARLIWFTVESFVDNQIRHRLGQELRRNDR
ncbi:hypothetical protein JQ604_19220 [Bradyrhizobium jicamae]|uniref:hypothetical protein n=1 Tax=Bradyrhizobium jicamae TaxID=280332 RepID=UPI001BA516C8|nr:hypothetical protein [Bradyrhizobium jicamae]MBR0754320.1 hypothetical protein [Bradyrhizobium jicamae]